MALYMYVIKYVQVAMLVGSREPSQDKYVPSHTYLSIFSSLWMQVSVVTTNILKVVIVSSDTRGRKPQRVALPCPIRSPQVKSSLKTCPSLSCHHFEFKSQ